MNAPLRIAMVTPHFLPHVGGVERHVHEVAIRLARHSDVRVTVITTDPAGTLPVRECDESVEIRRVRAYPRGRDWLFSPGIVRELRDGAWDVVHVQSWHTLVAPLAMAAAARLRLPYVVTFHGGGHSGRIRHAARGLQLRILGPLLRRAAALVALARFEVAGYGRKLGLGPERFVLIPNGVDLPVLAEDPARNGDDGPLIASVGRLERYKGHHRVLQAFPEVLAAEPHARLWIAGSGPYEAQLRRLAEELGVSGHVEISAVPAADRDRMAQRLGASDLVVLLSDFETQPIAVLEALGLGRPVLVARGSGLDELAERGWVRSVDAEAPPERIAQAVLDQLRDPLVPGEVHLPTWDACADRLLELYRDVARAHA